MAQLQHESKNIEGNQQHRKRKKEEEESPQAI